MKAAEDGWKRETLLKGHIVQVDGWRREGRKEGQEGEGEAEL